LTITEVLKGLLEEKEKGGGTAEEEEAEGNLYVRVYVIYML
jgi:hypothetical protein